MLNDVFIINKTFQKKCDDYFKLKKKFKLITNLIIFATNKNLLKDNSNFIND